MVERILKFVLAAALMVLMAPALSPYIVEFATWMASRPDGRVPALGYKAETDTEEAPTGRRAALKADRRGHFETDAVINGKTTGVLIDTGATSVVLRYEDAQRMGLRPMPADFTAPISTANGVTKAARVVLDEVRVGAVRIRKVEALVMPAKALSTNLLGMSFIRRLARVEMTDDRLVLVQ